MKPEISFEDFAKLDLKVSEIIDAEEIDGADKLWKLRVDLGEEKKRTICVGIREFYSADELIGKKIIVVANLKPRKMRGVESQGMLLASLNDSHSEVILVEPEGEVGWDVG